MIMRLWQTVFEIIFLNSVHYSELYWEFLTHWRRIMHICVRKIIIISSENGLPPGRSRAIICTNVMILLIGPLGTYFSEWNFHWNSYNFIPENLFENTVWKMASRCQCVFLDITVQGCRLPKTAQDVLIVEHVVLQSHKIITGFMFSNEK